MTPKEALQNFFRAHRLARTTVYIVGENTQTLIGVRSPFNTHYLEDLKRDIPYTEREWDGVHRVWYINASHYNKVFQLCSKYYFDGIEEVDTVGLKYLIPKPKIRKRRDELNKRLIDAIKSVVTGDYIETTQSTRKEDFIEILMDAWKEGSLTNEDTLEAIYGLINER